MTRLDNLMAQTEAHRPVVTAVAVVAIAGIAWFDWAIPDVTLGYLYLLPILLAAGALSRRQILVMAVLCAYLREAFDPAFEHTGNTLWHLVNALNPWSWPHGAWGRLVVVTVGFAMTGYFVSELNQRRRLLTEHLAEREFQMRKRHEAEQQVRVLIDTTPLAILMLDASGRVQMANESARNLLGFSDEPVSGQPVEPYLPILSRMLHSHRTSGNIRTNVECRGQRHNGEVFLAHVWLSTYRTGAGAGLAAVVWDASENLRDREGSGLDSMMATSRVLIGAISHEIRNLASAAASAHAALAHKGVAESEEYQALGTLIRGLEKIAASGLNAASKREAALADLETVLDETRIVIEPALREAGISVEWEIPARLPLVQADHHSLLQVFVNLARNSQQALDGRDNAALRIAATLESDLVIVRFRDNGPGVAKPEELFRAFHSGSGSHGLGLYISRAILRAHGGGLRYEPQDCGSCFTVELWPVETSET
jgi:two-component system, LuxR family, sensor kinase FixL